MGRSGDGASSSSSSAAGAAGESSSSSSSVAAAPGSSGTKPKPAATDITHLIKRKKPETLSPSVDQKECSPAKRPNI